MSLPSSIADGPRKLKTGSVIINRAARSRENNSNDPLGTTMTMRNRGTRQKMLYLANYTNSPEIEGESSHI